MLTSTSTQLKSALEDWPKSIDDLGAASAMSYILPSQHIVNSPNVNINPANSTDTGASLLNHCCMTDSPPSAEHNASITPPGELDTKRLRDASTTSLPEEQMLQVILSLMAQRQSDILQCNHLYTPKQIFPFEPITAGKLHHLPNCPEMPARESLPSTSSTSISTLRRLNISTLTSEAMSHPGW